MGIVIYTQTHKQVKSEGQRGPSKGQLISKWFFGILPKKRTKKIRPTYYGTLSRRHQKDISKLTDL